MIRSIILDMDDTLYPENQFRIGGYRAAADYLAPHVGKKRSEIISMCTDIFIRHGYRQVLSQVLDVLGAERDMLSSLIRVYRSHVPVLRLYKDAERLLKSISRTCKWVVLTDGVPKIQYRKALKLGLYNSPGEILFARELGNGTGKPDVSMYPEIMKKLCSEPDEVLAIGDNPMKDLSGAHSVGIKTVLVDRYGMMMEKDKLHADLVIKNLGVLEEILNSTGLP